MNETSKTIALGIEYDGCDFSGWQIQPDPNLRTVQDSLQQALSKIANEPIKVFCAGRTDTGVHGLGQVVHFETSSHRAMRNWVMGTNTLLPKDVSVRWAKEVNQDFHARFSAISRRYRYYIQDTRIRPVINRHYVSWHPRPLDETRMHEAAQALLGEHDFSSFRSSQCQAHSAIRTIHHVSVQRENGLIVIDVTANAFLHHMVRNIAGMLMAIGRGEQNITWAKQVLNYLDRSKNAITAPPQGLFFVEVTYPNEFGIPQYDVKYDKI